MRRLGDSAGGEEGAFCLLGVALQDAVPDLSWWDRCRPEPAGKLVTAHEARLAALEGHTEAFESVRAEPLPWEWGDPSSGTSEKRFGCCPWGLHVPLVLSSCGRGGGVKTGSQDPGKGCPWCV